VQLNEPVSVPTLLTRACEKGAQQLALSVKRGEQWVGWTYAEYLMEVRESAKGLIKLGLEQRRAVGIIGFNSPEWFIDDFADGVSSCVATGIYPTNSPEACKFIARDCRANVVVLEDERQLEMFRSVRAELPDLKAIVQYSGERKDKDVLSWKDLIELGESQTFHENEKNIVCFAKKNIQLTFMLLRSLIKNQLQTKCSGYYEQSCT
jgi:long-chain-fatty-acid--CoA ligase ACSBG